VTNFLLVFVTVVLLGFIVGLTLQETEWYRNFMHKRPILGWISTFLVGTIAWCAAAYALLNLALSSLGRTFPPIQ
jgi:asparagine N-glycosylation enzyme membrane subunit Stt3